MSPGEWNRTVKALAREAGFDRCGVAKAETIERAAYLRAWLDGGRGGSMRYLQRYFEQRTDPRVLLEGARSVIVVALSYHQRPPEAPADDNRPRGRVAMYAWGDDYHRIIRKKLHGVADALRREFEISNLRAACDGAIATKVCVDTTPLLEREIAAVAGVGWIGKNTLVLDRRLGSYFFLGEIVTTLEIEPDEPTPDRCGTCTRCLEACPTQAFPAPYQMDASRCISYLTIERREPIGDEFPPSMHDWIFGCDVCQQVCPYNRDAAVTQEPGFALRPPAPRPALADVLSWSIDDYRRELEGSAMKRATLPMLQRNARIALANSRRDAQSGSFTAEHTEVTKR